MPSKLGRPAAADNGSRPPKTSMVSAKMLRFSCRYLTLKSRTFPSTWRKPKGLVRQDRWRCSTGWYLPVQPCLLGWSSTTIQARAQLCIPLEAPESHRLERQPAGPATHACAAPHIVRDPGHGFPLKCPLLQATGHASLSGLFPSTAKQPCQTSPESLCTNRCRFLNGSWSRRFVCLKPRKRFRSNRRFLKGDTS